MKVLIMLATTATIWIRNYVHYGYNYAKVDRYLVVGDDDHDNGGLHVNDLVILLDVGGHFLERVHKLIGDSLVPVKVKIKSKILNLSNPTCC